MVMTVLIWQPLIVVLSVCLFFVTWRHGTSLVQGSRCMLWLHNLIVQSRKPMILICFAYGVSRAVKSFPKIQFSFWRMFGLNEVLQKRNIFKSWRETVKNLKTSSLFCLFFCHFSLCLLHGETRTAYQQKEGSGLCGWRCLAICTLHQLHVFIGLALEICAFCSLSSQTRFQFVCLP